MSVCYIRHKTITSFEKNDIKATRFTHSVKNLLEQELEPVETKIKNTQMTLNAEKKIRNNWKTQKNNCVSKRNNKKNCLKSILIISLLMVGMYY